MNNKQPINPDSNLWRNQEFQFSWNTNALIWDAQTLHRLINLLLGEAF